MAGHRLFEALAQADPQQAEQHFSGEFSYEPADDIRQLAPVRRVALVAEAFLPKIDGVSKTAYLTVRYLQATGREVMVFAPDIATAAVGETPVIRVPSVGMPTAPETRVALPNLQIGQHLDAFQPDVVHCFSPALFSGSAVLAARRRGIPVVANYQTDLPGYALQYGMPALWRPTRDWLRLVHNASHLTLVPSLSTLYQLRQWGFRRLRRWGRGVNGERFNPARRTAAMRQHLLNGRDPDSLLCLYVGRLAAEKRLDLLDEVARLPGVALTLIGDGLQREALETRFAGTGTHFMGYRYGEELAEAYASADVFLFPGPNETFGQVVQEAQASGLPAVVVDQGGVADLVEDGVTGYICPADAAAFAQAVAALRDYPAQRRQMAARARAAAEEHPWSAILAQLEGFYREAQRIQARARRLQRVTRWPLTSLFS